jgi:hypothetical protein
MKVHRVIPFLWLISGLAAATVSVQLFGRTDPLAHEAPSLELATADQQLSILWLGDLLLRGSADVSSSSEPSHLPPLERLRLVIGADMVIANAEAALRSAGNAGAAFDLHALRNFGSEERVALSLANDSTLDRQAAGVAAALVEARAAGLLAFGAGTNFVEAAPSIFVPRKPACRRRLPRCWEAESPFLIRSSSGVLAIAAFAEDYRLKSRATPDTAGFALLQLGVQHSAHLARRAGADWVVAYVHWGRDYRRVTERQRAWARVFADAGYDLVVGHHPHLVQPIEVIDGMPVVYSLGNIVFGARQPGASSQPDYGLMLTSEFGKDGPERLRLRCMVTDSNFEPHTCDTQEAYTVLRSLHPDIHLEDDVGVLPWAARRSAGGRT